jgi:hypothetical protein
MCVASGLQPAYNDSHSSGLAIDPDMMPLPPGMHCGPHSKHPLGELLQLMTVLAPTEPA